MEGLLFCFVGSSLLDLSLYIDLVTGGSQLEVGKRGRGERAGV